MNPVIQKFIISETSEGSYRLRGSFENREFSYESSDTEFHDFQKRVKVRTGFAEVLKIMNDPIN